MFVVNIDEARHNEARFVRKQSFVVNFRSSTDYCKTHCKSACLVGTRVGLTLAQTQCDRNTTAILVTYGVQNIGST
jgi:hypothetical protein